MMPKLVFGKTHQISLQSGNIDHGAMNKYLFSLTRWGIKKVTITMIRKDHLI